MTAAQKGEATGEQLAYLRPANTSLITCILVHERGQGLIVG